MESVLVLTIITESALKRVLTDDMLKLGAKACTVVDATARSHTIAPITHEPQMIRVEVMTDETTAPRLVEHLSGKYFDGYAMLILRDEKTVIHSHKFF